MHDDRVALALRALPLVDLTDLSDDCTPDAIARLCTRAVGPYGSTAAVCVWPAFVAQAAELVGGTGVAVATVVNFPHGGGDTDTTIGETVQALADRADEIDLVLPYHSFLDGHADVAREMVAEVRRLVLAPKRLKVILETGSYPNQAQIAAAARLAIEEGADFVKTSTGKTAVSATLAATETMLHEIKASSRRVGLKPSGGIRTLDDAAAYLSQADEIMGAGWADSATFRFGASGLLDALEAAIADAGDVSSDSDY